MKKGYGVRNQAKKGGHTALQATDRFRSLLYLFPRLGVGGMVPTTYLFQRFTSKTFFGAPTFLSIAALQSLQHFVQIFLENHPAADFFGQFFSQVDIFYGEGGLIAKYSKIFRILFVETAFFIAQNQAQGSYRLALEGKGYT
jgi:hypothetical protein